MGFAVPTPQPVRCPSYLYQHSSGYIFRLRIPRDLKSLIGKSEYRYSLRTGALRIAKHRARLLASHVHQVFMDLRKGETSLTQEVINQRIKVYVQSWGTVGCSGNVDPLRATNRDSILHEHNGIINPSALLETFQKAIQEALRRQGGLPEFPVEASDSEALETLKPEESAVYKFSELQKCYEAEMVKGENWTEKTLSENQTIFALFVRVIGDIPIDKIDRKLVSQYKGILTQLPPNMNMLPQYKGKSVEEVIASQPTKTLAVNTINKHVHWLSGLFNYAVNNGYMRYNPASGMLVKSVKRADHEREIYTREDLGKLFDSKELKASAKSRDRQHQYWVPLIAAYSGCRLEEICQLHLEDIQQESGVWIFDINGKQEKRLKNLSSVRLVPIHPRLIEYGFLEYVETLKGRGEERLFPFLHQRRDGYGQVVSKWFGRFKERCGIGKGKTFHSFRHTFITHLKHKQVDPFMIHELDGHAIGSETMGRYGKRFTPEILLREAIEKIDYGVL